MKKLIFFFCGILLAGMPFSSCKKDSSEPAKAKISFEFDFNVAGDELKLGQAYQINGTTVSFDAVNFYIGGIRLTQENGQVIDLSDQYLLGGIGNTATLNSDLDVSDINNMKFFVGVDPVTNAQEETDFTNRPPTDPLGIQDPSMHWSWSTGYKFLRVDGDVDLDGDGILETGVAYHLGSDAMLKQFDLTNPIELRSGDNDLIIAFDLTKFFTGVDLKAELDTHTGNNLPLAERLRDNLAIAIEVYRN